MKGNMPSRLQKRMNRNIVHRNGTKRSASCSPMYGLAITPKARGDEGKISQMLHKLVEEDPTFRWNTDRQTHEVVINGLGELHLRLVLERMKNRGLQVDTKPPKIA